MTSTDPYDLAQGAQARALQRRRRRRRGRARAHVAGAPPGTPLQATSPRQRQGRRAEARAAQLLRAHGLQILAQNLACRGGELDLVARDGPTLVFVEVRARHGVRFGGAAASVNRAKQRRLVRAAAYFLPRLVRRHFGGRMPTCRFDVVGIEAGVAHWIRQAFTL